MLLIKVNLSIAIRCANTCIEDLEYGLFLVLFTMPGYTLIALNERYCCKWHLIAGDHNKEDIT